MSKLSLSEAPSPSHEARRIELARELLRSAVRRYQAALAFSLQVTDSMPEELAANLPRPEREGWALLRHHADAAFDEAELALARRIVGLYDEVAPEGSRVPTRDDDVFLERAVKCDEVTFVVTYDPDGYQEETSIIAMLPSNRTVDLDD